MQFTYLYIKFMKNEIMDYFIERMIANGNNIHIALTAKELREFGENIANEVIKNYSLKVYTRDEVIEKFNVCSATLWRWDKEGFIQSKKISGRRYYTEADINKCMKKNK